MAIELSSQKMFANYFDGETTQVADPLVSSNLMSMMFINGLFYLMGVAGAMGGLYALRSQVGVEAADIFLKRVASFDSEAKLGVAILGAKLKYSTYIYAIIAFRVITGLACFGVAAALTKRMENANNLAVLVIAMAILYNLAFFILGYVTTSSAVEAAGLFGERAESAKLTNLVVSGGVMMAKLGVYCGLIMYLLKPSVAALFRPTPKSISFA